MIVIAPIPPQRIHFEVTGQKCLQAIDERRARILEQRYFGGLTLEETAEALNLSLATVKRELRSARAWLAIELQRELP